MRPVPIIALGMDGGTDRHEKQSNTASKVKIRKMWFKKRFMRKWETLIRFFYSHSTASNIFCLGDILCRFFDIDSSNHANMIE